MVLTEATRRQPAHSAYLVTRAESGFAGEAALILLLGGMATAALLIALRYRRSAYAGIGLGAMSGILAVSLHSNYEYALLTSNIMSLLFVIGALISGLRVVAARELATSAVRSDQRKRALIALASPHRYANGGSAPLSADRPPRETRP